jgi:ribonuclease R
MPAQRGKTPSRKTAKTGPVDSSSSPTALPDEAALLAYLADCPAPPDLRGLIKAFDVTADHRRAFRHQLREMADRGLITANKRAITLAGSLPEICVIEVTGIDDHGDGTGQPVGDDLPSLAIRIPLSRKAGKAAAVGQHILARLTKTPAGDFEAQTIRVLDRQPKRIFGILVKAGSGFRLQSADRGKRDSLVIRLGAGDVVADGDLVEAALIEGRGRLGKTARIIKNLGPSAAPGAFSALAIAEFGIRHAFPASVHRDTDGCTVPPLAGRDDLRACPLVTIDGADARDFDDAVYAEPLDDGGWRLLIAIADVAHYVRPGSALDIEAQKRGNSVYFPDRVVPMLPETLSNDLCSLRPAEDRAAMVAEIHITSEGDCLSHQIRRALIRSAARLTYDQVQAVFDGIIDETDCGVPHGTLHALFGAWRSLDQARQAREPLALNLSERRVIMDDSGNPVRIDQRVQSTAQRLIEDFMIAANVAAAETLIKARRPCVFRVHDTPDPKKAANLGKLAESLGGSFTTGQVLRPHHFNRILALAAGSDDELTVNETVLRSQAKAIYSTENIGHFGLSLRQYAHFTSPIRRYADLLVHRSLVDAMTPGATDGLGAMPIGEIDEISRHISETEATAASAERRTIDRFAAALFETRRGEVMDGTVSSVTGFGLFIRLDDGAADGLLPMRALPDDFYDFDEDNQSLDGRHNGWSFKNGARLTVRVVAVTPVAGSIMLEWVSGGLQTTGKRRTRGSKQGRAPSGRSPRRGKAKNDRLRR